MTNDLVYIERIFDKAIVSVLREPTVGYKMMPLNTDYKGLGKKSIETFGYKSRGEARTAHNFDRSGYDTVDIAGQIIKIPIHQTQVKIERRDFDTYVQNGVPINGDLAFDMIRAINAKVDAMVINGWSANGTAYDVSGMSQIAGTSVTGASVQTYPNSYKSVAKAVSALILAGIDAPAFNFVMNPTQAAFLMGSMSSSGGVEEYGQVIRQLNRGAESGMGRVYQKSDVTTGYGIVAPVATEATRSYFELIETVAPTTHAWYADGNTETGDVIVEVYTCCAPRFKHIGASTGTDPAIAYLTTLT